MTESRDVLVGLLKEKISLEILQTQGWYHIPVQTKVKDWPPRILAFYQGFRFGRDGLCIRYYGEIDKIEIYPRKDLFPDDEKNVDKAENLYFKVSIKELLQRSKPIIGYRPRKWIFIHTNMERFMKAEQTNDLYIGSYLEEKFWESLKNKRIFAEREWELTLKNKKYYIDFAVFCNNGKLAIETDGYTTHYDSREKIDKDTWRRNEIALDEWRLMQYTPKHVNENPSQYISQINEMIENLGGQENYDDYIKKIVTKQRKIGEAHARYLTDKDKYEYEFD